MRASDTILSIIITSHNQLGPLKFSLLALLDQKPTVPCEIIVVDCGSSDGTAQFLAGQAEKGSIRVISAGAKKGRTVARNQGAQGATGRYLMFLDPGILVGPNWWDAMLRTLEMDPAVAAVSGRMLLPDGQLDHAGLALLKWRATPRNGPRLGARSIHAGRPGDHRPALRPMTVQALTGEAIMTRTETFFTVGCFSVRVGREHRSSRPDFAGEASGVDYCLRLQRQGWTSVYRPEAIMTRLRQGGQQGDTAYLNHERDMAILGRTWLDRIQPDFQVAVDGSVTPGEREWIRPFVDPVLNFQQEGVPASRLVASIILNTADDLENTRACVEAVLENTTRDCELLLLTSGQDRDLNDYLVQITRDHRQCRVLAGMPMAHEVGATNRALALAAGRHIVLLSRKVIVTQGWLDVLVGAAEMNPHCGLVGPLTNRRNGIQQVAKANYDQANLRGLKTFSRQQLMHHASEFTRTLRLGGFCLLIKRELMARIGGVDPRLVGNYFEFNDYSLRANMAGYECLIARGCFVHHQPVVDQGQTPELERQWSIFKEKWGISRTKGLNAPLDLGLLLKGRFDPERHFQALNAEFAKSKKREKLLAAVARG